RSDDAAGFDLFAPALNGFEFAAHIAHARHAVGEEERKGNLFGAGEPVSEFEMNVHVPQAGDHKKAAAIDSVRAARGLYGFGGTYGSDAIVFDYQRLIGPKRAGADIHNGDVLENEHAL